MSMNEFRPVLRFAALSDVHYQDAPTAERARMALALQSAYVCAERCPHHKRLDAVAVVGDFANSGSEAQMQAFRRTLDENLRDGTRAILSVASHEFGDSGAEGAAEKLARIFNQPPDVHEVINGFHFISVSPSKGTEFDQAKRSWAARALAAAAAEDPQKPIFFFQHPHISDTVYGSINWGNDDLSAILMHYPQVIDFSGHSHAPINDPRSIHQRHFTSLGCGTLSYFELDEFDKYYGTVPPESERAAQLLLVEADAQNRVRITPYDLITGQAFFAPWEIERPSEPGSFVYTSEKRRAVDTAPYFDQGASLAVTEITATGATLTFDQARTESYRVNDYIIRLRRAADGAIARQYALWSQYFLQEMPQTLSLALRELVPGTEYLTEISARSFWDTPSANKLCGSFQTLCK
jgi:hypothetical protein